MALPKAVQKQNAEADRLHAEAYPEEKPPVAEVPVDDGQNIATLDPPTPTEETPPVQGLPADAGKTEEAPADWEHKYKVLKGKYDAEVPRLQQSNSAMQGRMTEMETNLSAMAQAQAQPSEPVEPGSHLSPSEIEDYGQDMIDVVKKAAREEFEPLVAQLQQENGQLRGLLGNINESAGRDARQTMLDTLDGQVANWREINGNNEFLGWLENVDPYSGAKKLDMLRQAFEGNNTARVAAFFKGYLNENAAYAPNREPNTAPPQVSLDTLVAPGRPADGTDTRAQEGSTVGKSFTQQGIADFYRDVQRGVYRNNPAGKDKLEAEIFEAQNNGRIT